MLSLSLLVAACKEATPLANHFLDSYKKNPGLPLMLFSIPLAIL